MQAEESVRATSGGTGGIATRPFVIGIGASAGGLEAIAQLVRQLDPNAPCVYVVLQHLSPSYRSMMVEILGRETPLEVREATSNTRLIPGTLYVVPANSNALYKNGQLHLVSAPPEVVPKPSINQFFISLAAEEGEAAVGILLSGTGSDGVAGLRAIQAAGGFTLVQKPDTAKYDGMPRAAIEAGVADHVLPPADIARQLPRLLDQLAVTTEEPPRDVIDQLLQRLRDKLQIDFSGYKLGTLVRRIRRREIATGNHDLASYLAWVESNPSELEVLARDILISVTAFFRDHDAFQVLRRAVQDICSHKQGDHEIRVWVAGCATGEEAYSVAMLFVDTLGPNLPNYHIQIFATDIDEEALNVARRGIYPAAALSSVPSHLLEQCFHPVHQAFEASKQLRDMIIFARHNLVSDPPFLRLDLVTCRNVLIYFDAPLQAKVLQTFHFGLTRDSYLFLGRSESVAQAEQLFSAIDRRERLFRKQGDSVSSPASTPTVSPLRTPSQRRERRMDALLAGLVDHFGATAVLCDQSGNILHSAGQIDRFLQFPSGTARLTVTDVTVEPLRGELLTLLHRCQHSGESQRGRRRRLGKLHLRIHVDPVEDAGNRQLLVLFVPEDAANAEDAPGTASDQQIETELLATREHVQTLVEEMATANEEMQALNEEAQAANEELQATNEELEAANEELQATNEELVSLNEELNVKTQELSSLTEEYAHLYDALQYPILVFDRSLQLMRFNSPASRRFDLRPTALRQHVSRLRLPTAYAELDRLLGRVLAHGDREEVTLSTDERTMQLSVTPGLNKVGDIVTLVVTLIDVSEITRTQNQLAESQARLSALMEKTSVIFAMKDLKGAYMYANRRFLDFFELDRDGYVGKTDFMLMPQKLAAEIWRRDLDALRELIPQCGQHQVDRQHGTRWLNTTHQVLLDDHGLPSAFIIEAEDITAAKQAEHQLRITAKVFDQAGEAIMVTDDKGVIQTINAAFSQITGYSAPEVQGQPPSMLSSGRHSPEFYQSMWQRLTEHGHWQGEIWNKRKNGQIYPEWLTINRVDNGDGQVEHYVAVFSDITQMKESQRRAEYLATHDPLTGLPNRTLFHDRLKHALAHARRNKTRVALLFIDLDNFKTINDSLGHDIGDELLRQAAARLREVMRDVDTVSRLGGDEFTAILANCSSDSVAQIASRVVDDLSASFEVNQRSLFVSASIGVAFYPEDSQDSTGLIRAADSAMYRAKEQGRNRVEFFMPDLHVRLLKRTATENALREALRHKRLRLVFQPKYALTQGTPLVGAEALLRWRDPELGDVPPGEFIPIAETSGLIREVDRAVEQLLLTQLASWQQMGLNPPPIAFNVSPRSIREAEFAEELIANLTATQLPLTVQVEITEGALLENTQHVAANLTRLSQAGFKIAIDDFGTGYSSLGYLKRLPLDELKIDKSFVDGLGQDKEDEAIAKAVLAMSQALGLRTVAEGVETEVQLNWLRAQGCDVAQGYYLSRPLESVAFEDLLARQTHHG